MKSWQGHGAEHKKPKEMYEGREVVQSRFPSITQYMDSRDPTYASFPSMGQGIPPDISK